MFYRKWNIAEDYKKGGNCMSEEMKNTTNTAEGAVTEKKHH